MRLLALASYFVYGNGRDDNDMRELKYLQQSRKSLKISEKSAFYVTIPVINH